MSKRILTPEQKAAKLQRQREWRAANPDKVKASSARQYQRQKNDPAFQEANRERVLKWQRENAEKVNEKNRAWRMANHESELEKERQYREENRDKLQAYSRKRRREEAGAVDAHGETRTGKCENPNCAFEGPLVFDHCHTSGLFRGWLCQACNKGLGCFSDDIARLEGIILYQKKFLDRTTEPCNTDDAGVSERPLKSDAEEAA